MFCHLLSRFTTFTFLICSIPVHHAFLLLLTVLPSLFLSFLPLHHALCLTGCLSLLLCQSKNVNVLTAATSFSFSLLISYCSCSAHAHVYPSSYLYESIDIFGIFIIQWFKRVCSANIDHLQGMIYGFS